MPLFLVFLSRTLDDGLEVGLGVDLDVDLLEDFTGGLPNIFAPVLSFLALSSARDDSGL